MAGESESIYRPPDSDLETTPREPGQWGSVERALEGACEVNIQDTISEAWQLVSGSKGVLIGLMALGVAVNVLIQKGLAAMLPGGGGEGINGSAFLGALVGGGGGIGAGMIVAPIFTASWLYSIKRAAHDPGASFSTLGECISRAAPIIATYFLSVVLMYLGFVLLIIPGIYLSVAYVFATALVAEKGMGVWEALETSRRAVTRCWFRIFGLMLVVGLIAGVGSLLTLGIGLIWFGPMLMLAYGVAYRDLFGYDGGSA